MNNSIEPETQPRRRHRIPIRVAVVGVVIVAVGLYVATILVVNLRPGASPPGPPSAAQLSEPLGALDVPEENATADSMLTVRGWAVDVGVLDGTGIDRVALYLDGAPIGEADYGSSRPDVAGRLGTRFDASGWSAQLDLEAQPPGPHQLQARARSKLTGSETTYAHNIVVTRPPSTAVGALDAPEQEESVSGVTDIRGWAIDSAAVEGTGIDRVQLFLDDLPLGDAVYRYARADVAANYGPRFEPSGFQARVDLSEQPSGPHSLEARAHSAFSGREASHTRTVLVTPPQGVPRGALDVPEEGAELNGVVNVRGWAIDAAVKRGTGVDRVQVFLDGELIGEAQYGYARADVASSYSAQFESSGFSMQVDLHAAPGGRHQLEARARSTFTGREAAFTSSIVIGGAPQ